MSTSTAGSILRAEMRSCRCWSASELELYYATQLSPYLLILRRKLLILTFTMYLVLLVGRHGRAIKLDGFIVDTSLCDNQLWSLVANRRDWCLAVRHVASNEYSRLCRVTDVCFRWFASQVSSRTRQRDVGTPSLSCACAARGATNISCGGGLICTSNNTLPHRALCHGPTALTLVNRGFRAAINGSGITASLVTLLQRCLLDTYMLSKLKHRNPELLHLPKVVCRVKSCLIRPWI